MKLENEILHKDDILPEISLAAEKEVFKAKQ